MIEYVKLIASVLFGGNVLRGTKCPVCGEPKSRMAACCKSCWDKQRQEARTAVFNAVRAGDLSEEAWQRNQEVNEEAAAMPADDTLVVRRRLCQPVLANLRVGNGAVIKNAKDSGLEYLDYQMTVEGGFVSIFVFGGKLDLRGKAITGLAEIKSKMRNGIEYRYIRVELVPGVRSDVELKVRPFGQTDGFVPELPSINEQVENGKDAGGEKRFMKYAIGFTPVSVKAKAATV